MKLSISTNIMNADLGKIYQVPMSLSVKACAAAGYQYLDANLSRMCRMDQALTRDGWELWVSKIRELADNLGIMFIQAHAYWTMGNLIQEDKIRHGDMQEEELMKRCVLAAEKLGVRWMVVHPYTVSGERGCDFKKSFLFNREYYKRWGEFYASHHVGMAIENLFSHKETVRYGCSAEELLELTDAIDNPAVRICIDTGHAHLSGIDPAVMIRKIGNHLKAAHIADNHQNKDEHFAPFNGTINWMEVMRAFKDIGYEEAFAFEIHNLTSMYPAAVQQHLIDFSFSLGEFLMNL